MPTPVGPAPRDPDDPDFWDWGDDLGAAASTNGGHDDRGLLADLHRHRRRRQLVSLAVLVILVVAILATSL